MNVNACHATEYEYEDEQKSQGHEGHDPWPLEAILVFMFTIERHLQNHQHHLYAKKKTVFIRVREGEKLAFSSARVSTSSHYTLVRVVPKIIPKKK